jgi:hypothetical protein
MLNKKKELQKEESQKNLNRHLERLKKINEAKIAALQSEYETTILEIKKNFEENKREDDLFMNSRIEDAKNRQFVKKIKKNRENGK